MLGAHTRYTAVRPRADTSTGNGRPKRYVVDIRGVSGLAQHETEALRDVCNRYPFRSNDSYLRLVRWDDKSDPIRRIVIPDVRELEEFGDLDPSSEAANTPVQGLQHKYADTALLLVTDQCGGFCRYCFRKRLFHADSREISRDVAAGLAYIRAHEEITDVLISGGDPMTLPTSRLAEILDSVASVPHIHTVRVGTRMLAYDPRRVLDDFRLRSVLRSLGSHGVRLYFMCHFDHPREITRSSIAALDMLHELGASCVNQCPVVAGVNDDAEILAELFQKCTDAGCPQYYVFQCRPAAGNAPYVVPIIKAFDLVSQARARVSGLSRRARYCLSHASGKVEIVGVDDARIYARYHRAKDPADEGRMLVMRRDDEAYWLDQLSPCV